MNVKNRTILIATCCAIVCIIACDQKDSNSKKFSVKMKNGGSVTINIEYGIAMISSSTPPISIYNERKTMLTPRSEDIKRETKKFMTSQFELPTEDFAQFILSFIVEEEEVGIKQYIDYVKQALKEFFNEQLPKTPVAEIDKPRTTKGDRTFEFEGEECKCDSYEECLQAYLKILFDRYEDRFEEILRIDRFFPGQRTPYFSKDRNELNDPQEIRVDTDIFIKHPFGPELMAKVIIGLANHFKCDLPTVDNQTMSELIEQKKSERRNKQRRRTSVK